MFDEELYLQQAKNSGLTKHIEVCAGITCLEALVDYYEQEGMFKPYVTAILKERIDKAAGLTRCALYYNIRIV